VLPPLLVLLVLAGHGKPVAAIAVVLGMSAAKTRPQPPCPSSLQRLLVAAVMAAGEKDMPTWTSGGTGGSSDGNAWCGAWWPDEATPQREQMR
jgi:hypothetical protein